MKILDVVQGSDAWLQARVGIPTSSNFKKIMSPARMKESDSQAPYVATLAAEWFLDRCLDEEASQFMERGKELEASAVAQYEFLRECETVKVGFCTTDDGEVGASPDRLVGEDGLQETKCPGIETHMASLLDDRQFAIDHRCQAQGQLYVTGRKWVDLCSYHPLLPMVCVRIERDEDFQESLMMCLDKFLARLRIAKAKLEPLKLARTEALAASLAATGDGQEDFI